MIRLLRILGFRGSGSSVIGIGEVNLLLSPPPEKNTPAAGLGGPRAWAVSGSAGDGA